MGGILDGLTSFIGTILYPLFSVIFLAIDGIQYLFYSFAGIEVARYDGVLIGNGNSGSETDTGIVYYLMNNSIVKNMLVSIGLLALFLLVVFTVLAIIKNAYSAKPKSWKEIVGNALKGLANFVLLPVCALLGVWAGNILLQAINGATSSNGATDMNRKLFIASAYNANLYRTGGATGEDLVANAWVRAYGGSIDEAKSAIPDGLTNEEYAQMLDDIYATTNIDIHWYWNVGTHYSLWQINYLVLIVAGIFMLYVLGSLAFAMVRRLFLILMLFMISPGMCAMYPLDEGAMAKKWRDKFKEQVLSAYGAVAGLNLFFALLPLIEKLEIGEGIAHELIRIFVLVTGLMLVKEFISFITSFVGGEDAYAKGSGLMKSATKEVLGRSGKVITGTVGAFGRAVGAARTTGLKRSFWSSLGRSAVDGLAGTGMSALKAATGGAIDIEGSMKAAKDGYKTGVEAVTKKREKQFSKYEYKKGGDESVQTSVADAIRDAKREGIALKDEDIGKILDGIKDKGARTKAAEQFARYQNQYYSSHHEKGEVPKTIITAEKILETGEKYKTLKTGEERIQASYSGYTSIIDQYNAAKSKVDGFVVPEGTEFRLGTDGRAITISSTDIEEFKYDMEHGPSADARQIAKDNYFSALRQNEVAEEFNKLKDAADEFESKIERAASTLQSSMEQIVETQKGGIKEVYGSAAEGMKQAIQEGQGDISKIIAEFDSVVGKFNEAVKEDKQLRRRGSGGSDELPDL